MESASARRLPSKRPPLSVADVSRVLETRYIAIVRPIPDFRAMCASSLLPIALAALVTYYQGDRYGLLRLANSINRSAQPACALPAPVTP